jgi:hypothetical protein
MKAQISGGLKFVEKVSYGAPHALVILKPGFIHIQSARTTDVDESQVKSEQTAHQRTREPHHEGLFFEFFSLEEMKRRCAF